MVKEGGCPIQELKRKQLIECKQTGMCKTKKTPEDWSKNGHWWKDSTRGSLGPTSMFVFSPSLSVFYHLLCDVLINFTLCASLKKDWSGLCNLLCLSHVKQKTATKRPGGKFTDVSSAMFLAKLPFASAGQQAWPDSISFLSLRANPTCRHCLW